jgi:cell wall-associated NlpC family hydrolase
MKTPSLLQLAALGAFVVLLLGAPRACAQVDATAWTSVEGTTTWARLEGWDGTHVLLGIQGRQFRVPLSRFDRKSAEKARRLLKLPPPQVAITPAKPVRSVAEARERGPVLESRIIAATVADTRPKLKVVLAWERPQPPDQQSAEPTAPEQPATMVARQSPPETGAGARGRQGEAAECGLPEAPEAPDPAAEGYAAVLPERDTVPSPAPVDDRRASLVGRQVIAPAGVPSVVLTAINAGNRLQTKTYKWGGGRARLEDTGYDCSGSVSYVLIHAGLLRSPINSGAFTRYGSAGPGRWITIHARSGHVFMTICGLRLDTGGHAGRGPRWCPDLRRAGSGFVMRHPPGF